MYRCNIYIYTDSINETICTYIGIYIIYYTSTTYGYYRDTDRTCVHYNYNNFLLFFFSLRLNSILKRSVTQSQTAVLRFNYDFIFSYCTQYYRADAIHSRYRVAYTLKDILRAAGESAWY
jgi:hypothetical protein